MTTQPARTTDVAALVFDFSDRLLVGSVRSVHQSFVRRALSRTGASSGRVGQSAHDAVATPIYASLSSALRLGSVAVRTMSSRGIGSVVEDTAGGRRVVSAVNGLVGDQLSSIDDRQAIKMSVRMDGANLNLNRVRVAAAYPDASHHLVIFVHGLCESDESWKVGRVASETSASSILIRYNTGLQTSANGRDLDLLIRRLVDRWPVRVSRITLVGHGMGGLVVRAATNHATSDGETWQQLIRDIVLLGAPNTGARLEKAIGFGSQLLQLHPAGTPLRYGHISSTDWSGPELTTRWGADRISAASLPRARYHFLAASNQRLFGVMARRRLASLASRDDVVDRIVAWLNDADSARHAIGSQRVG